MWKIGTVRGYNRGWTSDIYTEKTPDFRRFKYSFNKRSLRLILLYPWKNEKFNQNIIHWTKTLITPLFGIVHFKTNYNYRLSNLCFINELILVTYALISNAVENIIYRCWNWYWEMLLVRIGFCTTKSDIRQYWCFACFQMHGQMFKFTKHSFLNSILIWSGSELFFFFKREDSNITKSRSSSARQRNIFKWRLAGPTTNAGLVVLIIPGDLVQYC